MQSKHLPPCALSECKRHMCQTFVLKLKQTQDDLIWLCEALVRCYPSAFAMVQLCTSRSLESGLYIVLTTSQPCDFDSFACKLKSALASKAPLSHIEWVKQLNVRLQRLFGWGDASYSFGVTDCRPPQRLKCSFSWLQNADHPAPFYVVDLQKISSAEKLLRLRQELGDDAALRSFALKFIELFGRRFTARLFKSDLF